MSDEAASKVNEVESVRLECLTVAVELTKEYSFDEYEDLAKALAEATERLIRVIEGPKVVLVQQAVPPGSSVIADHYQK